MKKFLAITMASVMIFVLAACSQSAGTENALSEDGLYIVEYDKNKTKVKEYRLDSKDGMIVRKEITTPDGGNLCEYYDADGNLSRTTFSSPVGFSSEEHFSPDGRTTKSYSVGPDGSTSEIHYAENGDIIYVKEVAADGSIINEQSFDVTVVEDDGSYWETTKGDDGSVKKYHLGKNGKVLGMISTDSTGHYTETEYFDNGSIAKSINITTGGTTYTKEYYSNENVKSEHVSHADSIEYSYTEYYENGNMKYHEYQYADGKKTVSHYNEDGTVIE